MGVRRGFGSFSSWPGAASRALPAKRMQMSASHKGAHSCTQPAKDRGTRRPSLSSVTSDPLSMTRRVHTNMPPRPSPDPHPIPRQRAVSLAATGPRPPPGCPLPADDALARRLSLAAPLLRPAWLGRSSSHFKERASERAEALKCKQLVLV